ncbi:MAG: four helix bundle protein [Acidobacteria bacterium]|nr:four helix bundle protein [Acidobacteriota bacterium]
MKNTSFENLKVYQMSEVLADNIWDIVIKWDSFAKDRVGKQVIRATDSVGANIAEGTGRGSFQDNRRFVKIARGSLFETRHWLRRAYRRKFLIDEQINELKPLLSNLAPMLNGYLRLIGDSSNELRTKD